MEEGILSGEEPMEDEDGSGAEGQQILDLAVDALKEKLYDEDIADGIAQAIIGAPDPVTGLVDQATMLLQMSDEATEGVIPDDMYLLFAMQVMTEVGEIAEAAGADVSGTVMAEAVKQFIVKTVQNLGGDTTEVEQALASLNMEEVGAKLDTLEEG